jgi:hypothetical protein
MFECQIKNLELKRNPPPMTAGPWTCILKKKISGIFRFQFSPTSLFFPLGVHVSNFKEYLMVSPYNSVLAVKTSILFALLIASTTITEDIG